MAAGAKLRWWRRASAAALAAATVAIPLASAAPASGDTYCVGIAGCDLTHTFGHLQGALTASSSNAVLLDTVRIGPVTLEDGPFISSSPVDIVGAGVGQTVLTNPPGTTQPVLSLTGEGNETVSDLSIRLAPSTGSFVPEGLVIYGGVAGRGIAERLDISAPGPLNTIGLGAFAGLGATLRDSTVAVAPTDGSIAVAANEGATVERATLVGTIGLVAGSGAPPPHPTSLGRYLDITAREPVAAEGTTLKVESSLLRSHGPFSTGLLARGSGGLNESATLEATNVTVLGDGTSGGVGIRVQGVRNEVPRHGDATVILRNSLLANFATPISRSGESAAPGFNAGLGLVTISHSSYDQTIPPLAEGPGSVSAGEDLGAVDPRFLGPGDFHLADDSPLIDAGEAVPAPSADLDGAPRALDGNGDGSALPDIGAFEHATVVGPAPPGAGAGAPPAADRDSTAPRLSGVSLSHRRFRVAAGHAAASGSKVPAGTAFRFTLSEPAAVGVRFERAARSGRAGCANAAADDAAPRHCIRWIAVKRSLAAANFTAGPGTISFDGRVGLRPLHLGRYRARLLATDAAGNVGVGRTIGFRIVAR
jgi:hypothetical protein